MTQFDQRGQEVHLQYNAGRDMHFGAVHTTIDLVTELEKLKEDIVQARQDGLIEKKNGTDVEYHVTKAIQEAEEPQPEKKTLLDHLTTAKSLLEGLVSSAGLVTAIAAAIEAVQKLFS